MRSDPIANTPMEVQRAEVADLIAELRMWKEKVHQRLPSGGFVLSLDGLLWKCKTCKADVHEPCVRPNGEPYTREDLIKTKGGFHRVVALTQHVGRIDKVSHAWNRTPSWGYLLDLIEYRIAPEKVLNEVQSGPLYKRLTELGLLQWRRGWTVAK